MAARAYWQGQIRLALVSIPVEIYSATKSGAKISFNQIEAAVRIPVIGCNGFSPGGGVANPLVPVRNDLTAGRGYG